MAHTGIFATKAEIDVKVGEMVDVTGYTETNINNACKWAEAIICILVDYDCATNWATLNAVAKYMLAETEATLVAINFISYNMGAYNSRIEAETILDVRWAEAERDLQLLGVADVAKRITSGFAT